MKKIKWYILISFSMFFLIIASIFIANFLVEKKAANKLYDTTENIPHNKVGLLLGTSKYLKNGNVNLYYTYRLKAAVQLFKANKIDFIVISGDNGSVNYDEPTAFKNDLLEAGIPEKALILDYAGFRTLDSMMRIKEIFEQQKVTVISQKFHNERAIYLGNHFGVKTIGYNAKGVPVKYGIKVKIREYLARVKVFVDIAFNVQPKFLGKKIEII